ncbi:diguanylate cyclase [Pelomonas sp. CA6]|uniref:ligand-binding sensor domain-containing diguanylate cyclase n=1 Tax=Pelomonas sp. CA6 TaxID=2907999 RepID=UPI001F4C247B|nr:two-component regulator propeller domain-containing protein [Pelomonas sp. CA6]MCH7343182.1 diguanylate cyclase [Pelomonas sp. CA6]
MLLAWCLLFVGGRLCAAPAEPDVARLLASPTGALTQYKVDGWQTEQGLPLNTVQALLQSADGALWVGTAGGLARFDGVRFTTFDESVAPGMGSQPVFGFMEDAQHRLWIGHSQGAAVYENGRFREVLPPEVSGGRRVWAFAQAPDGVVWIATENGLVRWQDGRTRLYQRAQGLPTERLRALTLDRRGVLWIATSGGGLVEMTKEGVFTVHDPSNGFPHLQVRHVLADPRQGVWAATAGGGLVHLDGGATRIYTRADGLPTDHLTTLAFDAQGSLWIGSWGEGVVRFSEGRFSTLGAAGGLAGNQIWSLATDREGSVWVGTWVGGLNRLRNRAYVVFGVPEGLSHDNVRAVLHGRTGVHWVATAGGGLNRIEGGRIRVIGRAQGLPTEEISALHEDTDGSLWVGTYTAGVVHLTDQGPRIYGPEQGLPGVEVRAILRDRQGRLWVGTRAGLARLDGPGFVPVLDPGLPREGVVAMLEARDGTLWFGTAGQGLASLREGRFRTLTKADGLVSNWILSLYEDGAGSLWIGSNGEGLNRLRQGRLTGIRPADGLWDGLAQTILEDSQGQLWMSCNRGFYRVARADLDAFAEGRLRRVASVGFGPGDALRGTTFAGGLQPAGARDAQGRLWLPSANGLVIVDPRHPPGPARPPGVRLDGVLVDGQPQAPGAEVELPPGAVPLLLRYSADTLLHADRVRFRYRMEGLTRDWVEAGAAREAAFAALPHGRYRFRLAASADGQRWTEAEPLAVTVRPRPYETPWFIALALLALAGAVLGLVRLRTRSLQARQREMEHLVALRTEELRQANEHLSRLSFVDPLTGLANRRRFNEALDDEWRRARRTGSPLALIMADIDGFKAYNDLLGHLQGDHCLGAVAGVFAQAVGRAGDLAARYGGEEFVVLLPGADPAAAAAVAQEIRVRCERLAIPHPASPTGPVVTLSLGVAACVPTEGGKPESLISEADAALYRAKQEGRNRVC